jgi:hypothetical protein
MQDFCIHHPSAATSQQNKAKLIFTFSDHVQAEGFGKAHFATNTFIISYERIQSLA